MLLVSIPIVVSVATVALIGYWNSSRAMEDLIHTLGIEILDKVGGHLDAYLRDAQTLNALNAQTMRQGLLKPDRLEEMAPYFWNQGQAFKGLGTIAFANEKGEMVGANEPQHYIVFAHRERTGGAIRRYAPRADGGVSSTILTERPGYDARKRDWYRTAVQAGVPTWTAINVSTSGARLDLTAVEPYRDREGVSRGVFFVDVSLGQITRFLRGIKVGKTGQTFVMDEHGDIVASSYDELPYTVVDQEKGEVKRLAAIQSGNPLIAGAARVVERAFPDLRALLDSDAFHDFGNNQGMYVTVRPYQLTGFKWLLVCVVPESDFMEPLWKGNRTTIAMSLLFAVVAIGISVHTAGRLARPIRTLRDSTRTVGEGAWVKQAGSSHVEEVRDLAESFDAMAERLQETVEGLRSSRSMLANILDSIPQSVFWKDARGVYLGCNKHFAKAAGLPNAQDIAGRTDFELPWKEHAEGYRLDDRTVVESGQPKFHIIEPILHADGSRLWIDTTKVPLLDADGRPYGVLGVYEDITERKRTEQNLVLLSFALNHVEEAAFLVDEQARFHYVNDAACGVLGYRREELLELSVADVDPDYAEEGWPARWNELKKKRSVTIETRHRARDGRIFPVEISANYFEFEGKGFNLALARDITGRRRDEEEKSRLQTQLHQAQKMESVGRLAGGVAHDFNNMLMVILGHTELALGRVDSSSPVAAGLLEIEKAARHSADLTRQLLAFARKQTIAPKVMNLNETVSGMLRMLQRLIGEHIHLDWKPRVETWPVLMDPTQVDQILVNLAVNARDAISGVGQICIQTDNITLGEGEGVGQPDFVPGDYVMLSFSDNGCGMDKSALHNIFEPFFTTKGVGEGTGLGLATVYGIVRQNGGLINVHSEPGMGTTFRIYIPRHQDEGAETPRSTPAEIPHGNGETVLLVEDEAAVRRMGQMMLEQLGYRVLVAPSPEEALQQARSFSGTIQVLISDVVMPAMNGRMLAEELQRIVPELRCIFMSGYTGRVIDSLGVLDEGVHFLQKPFSLSALATKVREALDET